MNAWVQLELATVSTVHNIRITNRMDCCGYRLSKMEVRVGSSKVTKEHQGAITSNTKCGAYAGPGKDGQILTIQCLEPIIGKYITIQTLASDPQQINMAEVEVVGLTTGNQYPYLI